MSSENHPALEQLSSAFQQIPFNHMLGLTLVQLNGNHVVMGFNMKKELIGNYIQNNLHGGVISSVLDMAGGMIVMASAIYKHPNSSAAELTSIIGKASTVDLQISYLNPGRGDRFIAKAWLIKSGNTLTFTRMELHNQDDTLIAAGTGTYLMK